MARNIECKCERNLTCGYCLRNAKPWFYTLSDGSAIYVPQEKAPKGAEARQAGAIRPLRGEVSLADDGRRRPKGDRDMRIMDKKKRYGEVPSDGHFEIAKASTDETILAALKSASAYLAHHTGGGDTWALQVRNRLYDAIARLEGRPR